MATHTVKLTYFKPSGKYYADGEFKIEAFTDLYRIWDEVDRRNRVGDLPGLCAGSRGWVILVRAPDHPHDHPHLIFPEHME